MNLSKATLNYKQIFLLSFSVSIFLIQNTAIAISCSDVTERQKVIAKLLGGELIENDFFSEEISLEIAFTNFDSHFISIASDYSYYEKIIDAENYKIKRVTTTIYGQHTEIIQLSECEFWKRVLNIEYLIDNKEIGFNNRPHR